jgi:hypothetical protein
MLKNLQVEALCAYLIADAIAAVAAAVESKTNALYVTGAIACLLLLGRVPVPG